MAADLQIHVADRSIEPVLARFNSNTLGSKYFSPRCGFDDAAFEIIGETPSVWVGEVSWLKAALFGDAEAFVPDPVAQVHEIIGEDLPVIDDALIARVTEALKAPNVTSYSIATADEVIRFLTEHKGKCAFTVSW